MNNITNFVKRHPLVGYFTLAYALTWPWIPLVSVSPLWGFPAVFGPAIAAIIVAAVSEGRTGVKDLLGRMTRWRVGVRWYAVALGLPALLALTAVSLHLLLGATTSVQLGELSALNFVVFGLIVGEELGWRGYALPKLLAERSALSASLILGALWGAWHLPTFFIAGAPQNGLPFSAFVLLTVAYSVLFAWIYLHTRGSVLIATLLHGAINLSQGFFLGGVDPARTYWLLAAVYGVAALVVVVATGPSLLRKPRMPAEALAGAGSRRKRMARPL